MLDFIKSILSAGVAFLCNPTTISIIALILSIISFVRSIVIDRRNLKISISNFKLFDGTYYIDTVLENHSRLPITITDIQFVTKDNCIHLCKYREYNSSVVITVEVGNDIQEDYYTDGFPISLSQFDASNFRFKTSDTNYKDQNVFIKKIVILTTRGKIVKKINRNF